MVTIDRKIIDSLKADSDTKGKKIGSLESGLKRTESYMIGIAIVVAFGFGTLMLTGWALFMDSLNMKASSYQSLVDQVSKLNRYIESEKRDADAEELKSLREELSQIKKNNPYLK
jgi:hypothetical protein